jgi:hypothetical protein
MSVRYEWEHFQTGAKERTYAHHHLCMHHDAFAHSLSSSPKWNPRGGLRPYAERFHGAYLSARITVHCELTWLPLRPSRARLSEYELIVGATAVLHVWLRLPAA